MFIQRKRKLFLIIGVLLSGYSIVAILRPNGLMSGGITGLSRVLERTAYNLYDLNPFIEQYTFSIIYYILAIIVLLSAYIFLGKEEAMKILFMSLVFPLVLFVFTFLNMPSFIIQDPVYSDNQVIGFTKNLLIPALAYGILAGFGTGFILRSGYTSGGSDTIAKIIYRRFLPFLSFNQVLLIVDGLIILTSIFVFDFRITIYAIITKFMNMKSVDAIIFGIGNRRVKMEIISRKYEEIIQFIHNTVNRGVTIVDIEGGFSKNKVRQVITICAPRESLLIKNYIASIDEMAFVYVIPSSTVWGQGFRNIKHDELD